MSERRIPLLSVVIPTAGRPGLLPRAVESALSAAPDGDVEVIVVPNGPDQSWREAMARFTGNPRVRAEPIATQHANAARNHGLALARGRYVRFLDDDDYLLPGASRQIIELQRTGYAICSGLLLNVDMDGSTLGTVGFPSTHDFVCAAVAQSGFTLPVGNVFRRSSIADCRWNEAVSRRQDNVWMIELAMRGEWSWAHLDEHVGAWFQHRAARVSIVRIARDHPVQLIDALLGLAAVLCRDGRMTRARAEAISAALWRMLHGRFPFRPLYWHRVAREAQRLSPHLRPDHPIFRARFLGHFDPLLLEWVMLPVRTITGAYRDIKGELLGRDYRRRL